MKKRTIIYNLIFVFLFIGVLIVTQITYGWVSHIIAFDDNKASAGDLRYTLSGDFIASDSIIYPGEELVSTQFEITNNSPIVSQMRLKIEYTKVALVSGVPTPSQVNYSESVDDHLDVTFGSSYTFDETSGFWYYGGMSNEISTNSGVISLVTNISYDGNNVSIEYSNQAININITIQVKQYDNVTWSDLTSYNFSTGYPA